MAYVANMINTTFQSEHLKRKTSLESLRREWENRGVTDFDVADWLQLAEDTAGMFRFCEHENKTLGCLYYTPLRYLVIYLNNVIYMTYHISSCCV